MKVKIEIQETLEEDEVVIRCSSLNEAVISLQNFISEQNGTSRCLKLTDKETDYFVPMEKSISLTRRGGNCGRTRQTGYFPAVTSFMSWRNCFPEISCGSQSLPS